MTARMYGPKVSAADLNARVAERVDNCSDSLPWPMETESFFIGEFAHEPSRVQRSPAEVQERRDRFAGIAFAIFLGVMGAWVLLDSVTRR